MKILVTGGAGFIGSALVKFLINKTEHEVLNIDKLTYAANLKSLESIQSNDKYSFEQIDICDQKKITNVFNRFKPNAVMHLAAESHVDKSISGSEEFIRTNINGTHVLLTIARKYWESNDCDKNFRFLHVSTDEVYGSLKVSDPKFTELTPYAPNSPYAASKACSDHLVRAWGETFDFPVITTHCSNNYGPWQNEEKLIPLMITFALAGKNLPVYGDGSNIRDWIFVDDHVAGLYGCLLKAKPGSVYNLGGDNEIKNIDIVNNICTILDEIKPRADKESYKKQITFVEDRLGHDFRYAIDNAKIKNDLSWSLSKEFSEGLIDTIKWFIKSLEY